MSTYNISFQFPSNGKAYLNIIETATRLETVVAGVSIPFKRESISEQ